MAIKPVWLLDIDGVVNAISKKPPIFVWPKDQWVITEVTNREGTWPILAAKPVINFINAVADSKRAEIRWHTTWQEEALDFGDALGLRSFNVAWAPEFDDPTASARAIIAGKPTWWKLPAAQNVVDVEKRPLLWTDDDIGWELRRYDWHPVNLGTLSPDPTTGLTPKHLKLIDQWLKEWEGAQ